MDAMGMPFRYKEGVHVSPKLNSIATEPGETVTEEGLSSQLHDCRKKKKGLNNDTAA
jgi:hypothetical protein